MALLNKQQVETILKNAPKGVKPESVLDGLIGQGYELEGVDTVAAKLNIEKKKQQMVAPEPAKTPEEGVIKDNAGDFMQIGKDIASSSEKRAERINEIKTKYQSGQKGDIPAILEIAGQLAGAGADAIGNVFKGAVKMVLPPRAEQAVKDITTKFGSEVASIPEVQGMVEWYGQLPDDKKDALDAAGGAISLVSEFIGLGAAKKGATVAKEAIKEGADVAFDATKKVAKTAVDETSLFVKPATQKIANYFKGTDTTGLKEALDPETVGKRIASDAKFAETVKNAQKQGFKDADINFLSTVYETDKPIMKEMFDTAVKAQSNPRQVKRAADVLGENIVDQVRQVQTLNSKAGKAVDVAAKKLKGVAVDATPLKNSVISTLDEAGVTIKGNSLDFSGSVFKNTPALQKELQRVFQSIPDGSDAYQLHIFKKSIDELVNYGAAGEGLSGQISRIIKSFRASADEVLDTKFADYNTANTSFKQTKEFIDEAVSMVGKKVDLSTDEGAQAFGQAMRSAFSNSKSRSATLTFIENIQKVGKELKLVGSDKNVLDQAIFVTLLENTFGSEATTGLASEVAKGIKKAKTGINIIRNPVMGGLDAIADVAEKLQGISPEAKKKVLEEFIAGVKKTSKAKTSVKPKVKAPIIKKVNKK